MARQPVPCAKKCWIRNKYKANFHEITPPRYLPILPNQRKAAALPCPKPAPTAKEQKS